MIEALQAGKGALVGDLIEFGIRFVAKFSLRNGSDPQFWTWAAMIGGGILAIAVVVLLIRGLNRA
jgi:hypothetical protein